MRKSLRKSMLMGTLASLLTLAPHSFGQTNQIATSNQITRVEQKQKTLEEQCLEIDAALKGTKYEYISKYTPAIASAIEYLEQVEVTTNSSIKELTLDPTLYTALLMETQGKNPKKTTIIAYEQGVPSYEIPDVIKIDSYSFKRTDPKFSIRNSVLKIDRNSYLYDPLELSNKVRYERYAGESYLLRTLKNEENSSGILKEISDKYMSIKEAEVTKEGLLDYSKTGMDMEKSILGGIFVTVKSAMFLSRKNVGEEVKYYTTKEGDTAESLVERGYNFSKDKKDRPEIKWANIETREFVPGLVLPYRSLVDLEKEDMMEILKLCFGEERSSNALKIQESLKEQMELISQQQTNSLTNAPIQNP